MSTKDAVLRLIQQLPEDVDLRGILLALQEHYAVGTARGAELDYEWPAPDLTEEEWRRYVAYTLKDELADPRQDIYTEEDGEPYDG